MDLCTYVQQKFDQINLYNVCVSFNVRKCGKPNTKQNENNIQMCNQHNKLLG